MSKQSQPKTISQDQAPRLSVEVLAARLRKYGLDGDNAGQAAFDLLVFRLVDACLATDSECLDHEIELIREHGISARTIAETFVPRVAAELGEMWCQDNLGFARVTIGCARLQGLLRRLGPDWYGRTDGTGSALAILLITPQGEDHTLGALVTTGRLRRLGHTVHAIIGEDAEDISNMMSHRNFDLVLISTSAGGSLDQVAELVKVARAASVQSTRIAIGGTILFEDGAHGDRIAEGTGADLVTNDLSEALRECRKTKTQGISPLPGSGNPQRDR